MNHLPILLSLVCLFTTGCNQHTATAPGAASRGTPRFHCPMHPTYVSARQGDCPICNMKLTPIDTSSTASLPTPDTNAPSDRVAIRIAPEKQQLIGLRTAPVETRTLTRTLHATGTLQHDETAFTRIAPRIGGWVRKLHINYVGQPIEAGQPLLTVYSPELLAAEREYLIAFQRAPSASPGEPRDSASQLAQTARERLRLAGIDDAEINALEQRGTASDELLLRSPVSGHVITKTAVEGRSFMPGESLFEIGQLDPLWVRASVSQADLPFVRTGLQASVIPPSPDAAPIESTVSFVSPHLDPATRRGEFRLVIPNPQHLLRPEMWVAVSLHLDLGTHLAVPADAVIDTGTRTIVFIQGADHHLEPRQVRIGHRTDDFWAVLDGLQSGERVVTRALFLVDSESQLKAVIAAMTKH